MKFIKFIFQLSLFFFFCAIVLMASFAATLLYKPNLLINPIVLNYLLNKTSLKNYVSWEEIETSIEPKPDWRYGVKVDAKDICLKLESANGCMKSLSIATDLSLPIRQDFKIHTLGPVSALGVDLTVKLQENSGEEQPTDYIELLRSLLDIQYEPFEVSIDSLRLIPADASGSEIHLGGQVGFAGYSEGQPSKIDINIKQFGDFEWQHVRGEIELSGVSKKTLFQTLALKSNLQFGHKHGTMSFEGQLNPPDVQQMRSNEFRINYNVAGNKTSLHSVGILSKSEWDTTIHVDVKTVDHEVLGIGLSPCRLNMKFVDESPLNGFKTELFCRGRGQRQHLSSENVIGLFVPQTILFALNGEISFIKKDQVNAVETHVGLSIDRISSDLYTLDGQVLLDGTLDLNNAAKTNHELRFAIGFEVTEFQKVVRKLAETDISVPAPFNQLTGGATCDANGRFRTMANLNKFPISCESHLSSDGQKANLKADGSLSLRKNGESYRPHVDGDILIDDVLFTMPDIDIRKPIPQMFPDKRFVTKEELAQEDARPKTSPVSYDFRVYTSDAKPLRFRTELLPNIIPIFLDIKLTDESKMSGVVAIRDYQIELFKRTAKIENVEVAFVAGREAQDLKGKISFPNKDYLLGMDIYGTLQEPSYNFFSTPPLEENQILGLLLFGEEPSNLDDETQRSIGHTQNAMADKAVGLLSMYYLASTPIERLGYDPNAQVFTAQFRLSDGVLLTFGSDVDSKGTIGLRKKLKGNWSIDTTAERNTETEAQKGRASLNWSKRF